MKIKNHNKIKVKLLDTYLAKCVNIIKKDPSGVVLTAFLQIEFTLGKIDKYQKDFYFFEAEREAYGANMSYYNLH